MKRPSIIYIGFWPYEMITSKVYLAIAKPLHTVFEEMNIRFSGLQSHPHPKQRIPLLTGTSPESGGHCEWIKIEDISFSVL